MSSKKLKINNFSFRLQTVIDDNCDSKQIIFAREIEAKTSNVSVWLAGKSLPGADFLLKIVEKYNINMNWLLTGEGEMYNVNESDPVEKNISPVGNPYPESAYFLPAEKGQIPIIALADAGPGIFSTDQGFPAGASDEWLSRPSGFKDINAYALRIPDGAYSMFPALKPGMIVVVSPNTECQSGDMAVVKFRDGSATIKEIHYKNGMIELRAYNSDYATKLVSPADLMFPPQPIVWWRRAK